MKKIIDIKKTPIKHIAIKNTGIESHIPIHERTPNNEADPSPATVTNVDHESPLAHTPTPLPSDPPVTSDTAVIDSQILPTNSTSSEKDLSFKTVFMGTGDFAHVILQGLIDDPHYVVTTIITQPDKKIGRKKSGINRSFAPNRVRDIAGDHSISLFQPTKIDDAAVAHITSQKPDIIVVASYGKILPKKFLSIPRHGCINIHASLLPQLRGASPIQNALLLGLEKTGVTIMQMDEGLDTGDIIAQKEIAILEHEKSDELHDKIAHAGLSLFSESIPLLISKEITPQPQDNDHATLCQMIDREDGHIQWTQTTSEIYNRYRALYPWPGIFSYWEATENQMMTIKLRGIYPYKNPLTDEQNFFTPGTVFIAQDQLCIKTFDSAIIIEAVQPECKAVMPVYDFLNGHKDFNGAVLR